MIINLIKLIKILDNKDQFKLIILFLMTIIAMGLEVISIVAVLPVIRKFLSPEQNFDFLNNMIFFQSFDIIYLAIFLFILIHLVKFLYLSFFYFFKNKFVNSLSAKLTSRLFSDYLFKNYEFHTKKN